MRKLKQQATGVSKLFAELAEKETWFEFRTSDGWDKCSCMSPNMSSDLSRWRVIEPDLSMMVGSDIDTNGRNK